MAAKLNTAEAHNRWQPDNDFEPFYNGLGQAIQVRLAYQNRAWSNPTLSKKLSFGRSQRLSDYPPPSPKGGRPEILK